VELFSTSITAPYAVCDLRRARANFTAAPATARRAAQPALRPAWCGVMKAYRTRVGEGLLAPARKMRRSRICLHEMGRRIWRSVTRRDTGAAAGSVGVAHKFPPVAGEACHGCTLACNQSAAAFSDGLADSAPLRGYRLRRKNNTTRRWPRSRIWRGMGGATSYVLICRPSGSRIDSSAAISANLPATGRGPI